MHAAGGEEEPHAEGNEEDADGAGGSDSEDSDDEMLDVERKAQALDADRHAPPSHCEETCRSAGNLFGFGLQCQLAELLTGRKALHAFIPWTSCDGRH